MDGEHGAGGVGRHEQPLENRRLLLDGHCVHERIIPHSHKFSRSRPGARPHPPRVGRSDVLSRSKCSTTRARCTRPPLPPSYGTWTSKVKRSFGAELASNATPPA